MEIKEKISNVTSKIISSFWGTLQQINFDYTFKNGKTKNLTHEVFGKNDGVAILLYNSATKNVILSKQFRMPVYIAGVHNGFLVEVVGGAIDPKESPENSAIRETEEEVGYKVKKVKRIATVFLSPGLMKEQTHLFIAAYNDADKVEKGGGLFGEGEEIEVLETPFVDALKMIENQQIIDVRTILLLQYVQLHQLIEL